MMSTNAADATKAAASAAAAPDPGAAEALDGVSPLKATKKGSKGGSTASITEASPATSSTSSRRGSVSKIDDELLKALLSLDRTGDKMVNTDLLVETLTSHGYGPENPLMKATHISLSKLKKDYIHVKDLYELVRSNGVLITKVLTGDLTIPDFAGFAADCQRFFETARAETGGAPAAYIPQLANVNPELYAMSITTIDGQSMHLGDYNHHFCIQSTSKPVTYALALEEHGEKTVHGHVGREPSGRSFNEMSLKSLAPNKRAVIERTHIPHNPMINAGAMMCSSLIKRDRPLSERLEFYMKTWSDLCASEVGFDAAVFLSERDSADRNHALGYMMKENHSFPEGTHLEETLEFYFQTCSVQVNCKQMSRMAATLASGGMNPITGKQVFEGNTTRNVLSLMLSCGMYDFSGEWAFSIGLPAKSGVSGVVSLVVPNVMGIAIWSPRVNEEGNSVRAIAIAQALAAEYNLHMFHSMSATHKKSLFDTSTRVPTSDSQAVTELMFAAQEGDVGQVARMFASGINLNKSDYDKRTALHVAASEGHYEVLEFLLTHEVNPNPRDRWKRTPLSDAKDGKYEDCVQLLIEHGGKE